VVAAEPVTDVDTTAADMLVDLDAELDALGVTLVFAELKDAVRRRIERYELTDAIETRHFFATVNEAVESYREQTGQSWAPGPSPYALRQRGGDGE
jgi:MFS superfamily sulfate permease-like transporter